MSENYGNNLVSVLDEEGNEHQFELLDAIETDEGRYVALLPIYTEAEAALERPTLDQMTEYITADLEYAVAHVAEKQAQKGRYTADYARFCLMRHYLN